MNNTSPKTALIMAVSALLVAFGVSNLTSPNVVAAPNGVQNVDVGNDIHFFLSTDERSVTLRASEAVRQANKSASVRARKIASPEDVYKKLSKSTGKNGEVLVVDEASVKRLDPAWLKNRAKEGLLVIGVGIQVSEMCALMDGPKPDFEDLRLEYLNADSFIASLCWTSNRRESGFVYGDFNQSLESLPTAVLRTYRSNQSEINPK